MRVRNKKKNRFENYQRKQTKNEMKISFENAKRFQKKKKDGKNRPFEREGKTEMIIPFPAIFCGQSPQNATSRNVLTLPANLS